MEVRVGVMVRVEVVVRVRVHAKVEARFSLFLHLDPAVKLS